jgi:hypothetical protein
LRRGRRGVKLSGVAARQAVPGGMHIPETEVAAMEFPQVRPGRVKHTEPMPRVVAFFFNSAEGNLAIQLLTKLGIPNDRLGVTPPERIETGQGMILSISCPDEALLPRVEAICRQLGARIHRQRR